MAAALSRPIDPAGRGGGSVVVRFVVWTKHRVSPCARRRFAARALGGDLACRNHHRVVDGEAARGSQAGLTPPAGVFGAGVGYCGDE